MLLSNCIIFFDLVTQGNDMLDQLVTGSGESIKSAGNRFNRVAIGKLVTDPIVGCGSAGNRFW